MKHEESNMQRACIRWFDAQYGHLYNRTVTKGGKTQRLSLLFAVPNGGRRGKVEAAILSGEGVRPGVSDLVLAVPSHPHSGLFMELKTDTGRPTESQKAFAEMVRAQGYRHEFVRSVEQFIDTVNGYLKNK